MQKTFTLTPIPDMEDVFNELNETGESEILNGFLDDVSNISYLYSEMTFERAKTEDLNAVKNFFELSAGFLLTIVKEYGLEGDLSEVIDGLKKNGRHASDYVKISSLITQDIGWNG